MPTKTQAIATFLNDSTIKSPFAAHYNHGMECQVNVASDGGTRMEGEFNNHKWVGWTNDAGEVWKPFRIPYNANSTPTFEDKEMNFDLSTHAEAIGMTGWNWSERRSIFFSFDFDSIIGHSEKHTAKLTNEELSRVLKAAKEIPWVTITHSTGGNGYHLFVELKTPVETSNHNEHSALARAILGTMSALVGFDFNAKVDICGGNVWVWSRRSYTAPNAFKIITKGNKLDHVPPNWREHIRVTSNKGRCRTRPRQVVDGKKITDFEELSFRNQHVPLDEDHRAVIHWLEKNMGYWIFDQDHHMLVTHTKLLERAYLDLGLKGYFKTCSEGNNLQEQNCFCFPMRKGAWSVRRFSQGCVEHPSWIQDNAGWTRTYLNKECDLATACRAYGGIENKKGAFIFTNGRDAMQAASLLGCPLSIPEAMIHKEVVLSQHKDGRLIVDVDKAKDWAHEKTLMPDWSSEGSKPWTKILGARLNVAEESEIDTCDDLIRSISNDTQSLGWVAYISNKWVNQPLAHIKEILKSQGIKNTGDVSQVIGDQILKSWNIVNLPFEPEYPGDRKWNRNAARFRFKPSEELGEHKTWDQLLKHCGHNLDSAVKSNIWCKTNGVSTGAEYLKLWCASLVQKPMEPLPYLFFYSQDIQNTGKSSFHEALSLLMTSGYKRADLALTNSSGFNGELEGAVLCVIEEVSFKNARDAIYNRIKDYVTSPYLNIRWLHQSPYMSPNSTHWIQCANDISACPAFAGDTRITFIKVDALDLLELIPKKVMMSRLEKEAPNFLATILDIEIPNSGDRLALPILNTNDKCAIQDNNKTVIQSFAEDHCKAQKGARVPFVDVYNTFVQTLSATELGQWSDKRFSKELGIHFEKGKDPRDSKIYFVNMKLVGQPLKEKVRDKEYKIVYKNTVAYITEV